MNTPKTVPTLPSPPNDQNYFRAMVDVMIPFLRKQPIGAIISYSDLMQTIETDSKQYACHVFAKAKKHLEVHDGIFFKNRIRVGYERVSSDEAVNVCEKDITQGMKKVRRGAARTHCIDMTGLSENKRNRVVAIQSTFARVRLLQDLAGN
ncbi:MAG: hypothetical protein LUE17_12070 [Planctomycetaceae bacterium]|nr:hypothetical protein [Planctomycetaceae bacterium]